MNTEQSCKFNSDCRDLTATCISGKCSSMSCDNTPSNIDELSNDDISCMNLISSGKSAGCYTCPNARASKTYQTCDCGPLCVLEKPDERYPGRSLRCCTSLDENGYCVDDEPSTMTPDNGESGGSFGYQQDDSGKTYIEVEKPVTAKYDKDINIDGHGVYDTSGFMEKFTNIKTRNVWIILLIIILILLFIIIY